MPSVNTRNTYRITPAMLDAGAASLEQCCQLGGHTPRTVCQAVFTAMLGAADINPGASLPKSFVYSRTDSLGTETRGGKTYRGIFLNRPPLEHPLATYHDLTLQRYTWQGYFWRYRKHCLMSDQSDWIWLYESDWMRADFAERLSAGAFRANAIFCFQNLKCGQITIS